MKEQRGNDEGIDELVQSSNTVKSSLSLFSLGCMTSARTFRLGGMQATHLSNPIGFVWQCALLLSSMKP